jgi:integrase/recombinase XerD
MSWVSNAMERLKPGSVNSYLRSFKAFYNYLADEEYIKESPLRRLKLLLVERVLRPTLRPEEVQRLLDSIPKHTYIGARNRAMIMVAYDSMLRVSEIMRLKVQNVKFDDACIEVERSKSKTYRFVPMSRLTIRIIHEFVYRYRDGVPGDLLFPVEDGHKLGRGSFNLILRRVGRAIGISVHPHMLRRSGATGYVRNGGSIEMVKLILGHSSIKITEAYVQIADKETIHLHEDFSPAARMKRSAS